MELAVLFVLCSLAGSAQPKLILLEDNPFERAKLSYQATLICCFRSEPSAFSWVRRDSSNNSHLVTETNNRIQEFYNEGEKKCGNLILKSVKLNDTGFYQCLLNRTVYTPGTYLQVYKPMEKLITLSESTKNAILIVEGILLMLCVLVPSTMLLFKSKSLHQLEMKKMKREEENIYQGLNLEDCCSTYDQIERSQAQGPYQDVGNMREETGEIQLEKP